MADHKDHGHDHGRKHHERSEHDAHGRPKLWAAAAGMGIGSAALVAALLYSNRGKKTGSTPMPMPPAPPAPPPVPAASAAPPKDEAGPGEFGE